MARIVLGAVADVAAEKTAVIHRLDRLHGPGHVVGLLPGQSIAQVPEDQGVIVREAVHVAGQVICR